MSGPHRGEVPSIQRKDHIRIEPLGEHDNGCVCRAEREVGVLPDQFRYADELDEVLAQEWPAAIMRHRDA
jgi:hypothetical protein